MLFNNDFMNVEMVKLPDDNWGLKFKDLNITVKVDKVWFTEKPDKTCVMSLNYVIIEGASDIPKQEFKKILGDVVLALLEDKVKINEVKKTLKFLDNNSKIKENV